MATATKKNELATTQEAPMGNASERFASKVLAEFGTSVGAIDVSDYQRGLIQNYFIAIDRTLKVQEENRLRKNDKNTDHKYDNNLPYTWENVNLRDLALDVVHFSRMGLDATEKNHVHPIPYKNNKTNKYDITLMPGYAGIEYVAMRYAADPPRTVTVELVYESDRFKPIKKSRTNSVESYDFDILSPFDRGDIIGGFGYIEYDDPVKNELVIMSIADILKRKPQYASKEFWSETDGWYSEMCLKTIKREVYSEKHIPRDPQKIDEDYRYMKSREAAMVEVEVQQEIAENANQTPIPIPETPTPAGTQPDIPPAPADDLP